MVIEGDVLVIEGDVQVIKGDVLVIEGNVVVIEGDVVVIKGDVVVIRGMYICGGYRVDKVVEDVIEPLYMDGLAVVAKWMNEQPHC